MRKCVMNPHCVVCGACVFLPQLIRGSNDEEEILGGKCSSSSSLFNVTYYAKEIQKVVPAMCRCSTTKQDCCASRPLNHSRFLSLRARPPPPHSKQRLEYRIIPLIIIKLVGNKSQQQYCTLCVFFLSASHRISVMTFLLVGLVVK